jgi:hypothetical protein
VRSEPKRGPVMFYAEDLAVGQRLKLGSYTITEAASQSSTIPPRYILTRRRLRRIRSAASLQAIQHLGDLSTIDRRGRLDSGSWNCRPLFRGSSPLSGTTGNTLNRTLANPARHPQAGAPRRHCGVENRADGWLRADHPNARPRCLNPLSAELLAITFACFRE